MLGSNPDHPGGTVDVSAPVSGVITDQQITNSAGVQALTAPNPFTISDVSHVWILCDVYENDLAQVHLGEYADIHLNAYPDRVLKGRIGNITYTTGTGCIRRFRTTGFGASKWPAEICFPGTFRKSLPASSRGNGLSRTPWLCKTRWSNR